MAIFVTIVIRPPDPERFEAAIREFGWPGEADGAWDQFFGKREGDPSLYVIAGKWDSHEAMHRYTDRIGGAFNARAGTEDAEWQTLTWEIIE